MKEIEDEMVAMDLKCKALLMELILEIERLKEVVDTIATIV
jgi:hypothetical protein